MTPITTAAHDAGLAAIRAEWEKVFNKPDKNPSYDLLQIAEYYMRPVIDCTQAERITDLINFFYKNMSELTLPNSDIMLLRRCLLGYYKAVCNTLNVQPDNTFFVTTPIPSNAKHDAGAAWDRVEIAFKKTKKGKAFSPAFYADTLVNWKTNLQQCLSLEETEALMRDVRTRHFVKHSHTEKECLHSQMQTYHRALCKEMNIKRLNIFSVN